MKRQVEIKLKLIKNSFFLIQYIINYEYNNKKPIISENNPVASAKAKPKIA